MVAPSFDIVSSPSGLWSILSMPLGPSEDRKVRATVRAAKMFDFWASRPLMRFLFAPSCEGVDAVGA